MSPDRSGRLCFLVISLFACDDKGLTGLWFDRERYYALNLDPEHMEKDTDRNLPRRSAQAVGGAVGHNEISIIVPCHRVVGKNGSLTGYAGGIDKKTALLKLEGAFRFHLLTFSLRIKRADTRLVPIAIKTMVRPVTIPHLHASRGSPETRLFIVW